MLRRLREGPLSVERATYLGGLVAPGRYELELAEFVSAQREARWLSEKTCQAARWQISKFLDYLELRGVALSDVMPTDVDAFFEHMAPRWSRSSLCTSGKMLRAWFRYCEPRGWARSGIADRRDLVAPRLSP